MSSPREVFIADLDGLRESIRARLANDAKKAPERDKYLLAFNDKAFGLETQQLALLDGIRDICANYLAALESLKKTEASQAAALLTMKQPALTVDKALIAKYSAAVNDFKAYIPLHDKVKSAPELPSVAPLTSGLKSLTDTLNNNVITQSLELYKLLAKNHEAIKILSDKITSIHTAISNTKTEYDNKIQNNAFQTCQNCHEKIMSKIQEIRSNLKPGNGAAAAAPAANAGQIHPAPLSSMHGAKNAQSAASANAAKAAATPAQKKPQQGNNG